VMEWKAGRLAEAVHHPLDAMKLGASLEVINGLDPARPIAVHCKSGYRSSAAASLLQRAGYRAVMNVTGGFDAWQAQKLPAVSETAACPA